MWFNFEAFQNPILFQKFWCRSNLYFPRTKNHVTTQLRENFASYMLQVHCVTHMTNLASQILWKLPLVSKIEAIWKIHWILMLSLTKQILIEYKSLRCKHDLHPHPFMAWLLKKHWRALFIVHVLLQLLLYKLIGFQLNLLNKLQLKFKIDYRFKKNLL